MAFQDELIRAVADLYRRMDRAYALAAREARFSCEGCHEKPCCEVDLLLHSFVEKLYLRLGFLRLDVSVRSRILDRCGSLLKARRENHDTTSSRSVLCALHFDGLCSLYSYRPMICRLAGIPHFLVRPDGKALTGNGCPRYEHEIRELHPNLRMDRTGFYREMASIESEIVRSMGRRTRAGTIAEVLTGTDPDSVLLSPDALQTRYTDPH